MQILKKILKWVGVIFLVGFIALVIGRAIFFEYRDRAYKEVDKIHATKLTLDDVMGKNLPPDPGADADKTVEGIDANKNGIRDDVELAIFKEYPNSAKTRAVLLQYALALQMEVTRSMVNSWTVGAVVDRQDESFFCVGRVMNGGLYSLLEDDDTILQFVHSKQLNTEIRKVAHKDFYSHLKSGALGKSECDIDLDALPN